MAATPKTLTPVAPKPATPKRTPKTVVQRVTDQLKVAALRGKISADELDIVQQLATSLKTFIKV